MADLQDESGQTDDTGQTSARESGDLAGTGSGNGNNTAAGLGGNRLGSVGDGSGGVGVVALALRGRAGEGSAIVCYSCQVRKLTSCCRPLSW